MPQLHSFVYFGTPGVAAQTLLVLIEHGFVPALVVTSPDAPRGRGLSLTPSETKTLALEHAIEVFTSTSLDENAIGEIKKHGCQYALCVAYGKIFPEALINAFPLGVLNVHYSLLPKYRGASPLEGALLAGETETGVTIQKMVKELDAGDIIAQESIAINESETARELRPRLIHMGAELLVKTLPDYLGSKIAPHEQDRSKATRSGKFNKDDGKLDLVDDPRKNWNKYRAFADSIGTYFIKDGKRYKITHAAFKNGTFVVERVIPEGKRETVYIP